MSDCSTSINLLSTSNIVKKCLYSYDGIVVVFVGLKLNNAWASGTVLRPFLQPESPLSSRSSISGFKCRLRYSNSRPPYSRPRAPTTRLYTPSTYMTACLFNFPAERTNGAITDSASCLLIRTSFRPRLNLLSSIFRA